MDPLPDFLTRVKFGAVRLTGTRIDLEHVVNYFNEGDSAEIIHRRLPSLTLAQVYTAVGYYLAHRAEVNEYIRANDEAAERLAASTPQPDWEAMRRRFEVMKAAASLPACAP